MATAWGGGTFNNLAAVTTVVLLQLWRCSAAVLALFCCCSGAIYCFSFSGAILLLSWRSSTVILLLFWLRYAYAGVQALFCYCFATLLLLFSSGVAADLLGVGSVLLWLCYCSGSFCCRSVPVLLLLSCCYALCKCPASGCKINSNYTLTDPKWIQKAVKA